jgi:hypothetical protein
MICVLFVKIRIPSLGIQYSVKASLAYGKKRRSSQTVPLKALPS